ncbi:Cation efflux protein zinc transporter [Paragonimus heterotremus]|uniref:Cation efflux protein zinc transporter n=1 Tax=Paragonimus heterotremus TaxID=100268 RepID=A0A8J4WH63_9TREM|nr:Cation efflux protein zinc transporter [Paragonimus heterotremus]
MSTLNSNGSTSMNTEDGMELTQRLCHQCRSTQRGDLSSVETGQTDDETISQAFTTVQNWRTHPIELFICQLSDNNVELKKASRMVRKFYKKQDAHIKELEKLTIFDEANTEDDRSVKSDRVNVVVRRSTTIILRIVFFSNLILFLGKAVASAISGSLSIISSLLDSCVDLASGGIMWYASRQMRKRRPYSYPQGRTRFEPIAIIVLAVFMATISLQLLVESGEAIYRMSKKEKGPPNITDTILLILTAIIVVKLVLWFICAKFGHSPAVRALMVDQRNDVFSNAASLLFSGLASRLPPLLEDKRFVELKYLDPIGAILMSLYIIFSWYQLGAEQTRNLAGHTADPEFIQKIAFVSLNHHPAIERLDTIRAFHFGCHFLVEVSVLSFEAEDSETVIKS